jgi:hypothetical protein
MVPSGAEIGAVLLAPDVLQMASNCTQETSARKKNGDAKLAVSADASDTSGTQPVQSASNCTVSETTSSQISPRGLEPLTFGSGGRRRDCATSKRCKDLRRCASRVVITMVLDDSPGFAPGCRELQLELRGVYPPSNVNV